MILNRGTTRTFCFVLAVMSLSACQSPPKPSFAEWLAQFKQEAASQGISQAVLDDAFAHIQEPAPEIIKIDRKQVETTKSFAAYRDGLITRKKIDAAREEWEENRALFDRVSATYGVPAPILLALWGIESNFGERQGEHSVIQSLTTLAYDNRRSLMFRKQLIAALQILQQENLRAEDLIGSWAGAMGQIQFMPTSYLSFAVDFDGDGKKDIWLDEADALASMANYLHQRGWNPQVGWGIQVALPHPTDMSWLAVKDQKPVQDWRTLGVRAVDGTDLPQMAGTARLIMPDDNPAVAFLAFSNYNVLLDWNHSTYFATTVGLLADAINQ